MLIEVPTSQISKRREGVRMKERRTIQERRPLKYLATFKD